MILSPFWDTPEFLQSCTHSNTPFQKHPHGTFTYYTYASRQNLFTFGHHKLDLPFTVIGPPMSVSTAGISGHASDFFAHIQRQKGFFLALNLTEDMVSLLPKDIPTGTTLPTCVLNNNFSSFEAYVTGLRSGYRRRVLLAEKKSKPLVWRSIPGTAFDQHLHQLYLNVLQHSKFPLESLEKEFFQNPAWDIHVLAADSQREALAFVMLYRQADTLYFIFGGMDYTHRDTYDLYYAMLLKVIREGIRQGVQRMDLGQTAESTKCRLGCHLEARHMCLFTSNPVLRNCFRPLAPLLSYKAPTTDYRVFRDARSAGTSRL